MVRADDHLSGQIGWMSLSIGLLSLSPLASTRETHDSWYWPQVSRAFCLCPCWSTLNSLLTFDCQSVVLFFFKYADCTHPKCEHLFMCTSFSECVRWFNCLFLWCNNSNYYVVWQIIDCWIDYQSQDSLNRAHHTHAHLEGDRWGSLGTGWVGVTRKDVWLLIHQCHPCCLFDSFSVLFL